MTLLVTGGADFIGINFIHIVPKMHKEWKSEKLVALSIINILSNKKINIYGEGLNIRDWIYVEDYFRAITSIKSGKTG